MSQDPKSPEIDGQLYRKVLGQYPTGVCVVTAVLGDDPVAMVVGSFTSVSLNPPLVAFFPDKASGSWAKLRDASEFCVNILAAGQEAVCRQLASKDPNKFAGIGHRISDNGVPVLEGVVAWLECQRFSITDAGDHDMVLGRITHLDIATGDLPLLFFQGGYGRFAPSSLSARDTHGLTLGQLREVDKARPVMENLAKSLSAICIATVRTGRELAVVASAGQATRNSVSTLVGQRLPFVMPTGSVFAAWLPPSEATAWLARCVSSDRQAASATMLGSVRRRGYSVGLISDAQRAFSAKLDALAGADSSAPSEDLQDLINDLTYDPEELSPSSEAAVRLVSAPVFNTSGEVAFALTIHDFPKPPADKGIRQYIDALSEAAATVSRVLGGGDHVTRR